MRRQEEITSQCSYMKINEFIVRQIVIKMFFGFETCACARCMKLLMQRVKRKGRIRAFLRVFWLTKNISFVAHGLQLCRDGKGKTDLNFLHL